MKKGVFFVLFFLALFGFEAMGQNAMKYSKAKVLLTDEGLTPLARLGIAVDNGEYKKNTYIISDFSENEISLMKNHGFTVEILIDDVSKYYEERNKKQSDQPQKKSINAVTCSVEKYPTPNYFSFGSVGGYYSYEEIVAALDSMHQRFPGLVSARMDAGTQTTIEGRHLWYVKISDNPDVQETEPEIVYSALTHAREPMGMQQLFFYMYYLLENYNTNSTAKYILDNTQIYFLPCVNPDGYTLNQTTNPSGGGMHRKNCRQTGASVIGIDLNRNYGYEWGYDDVGSSPDIESLTYRGTEAFSEAETQIMKGFMEQHNIRFMIDYHTYSNVLIIPWSYDNLTTPDDALYNFYAGLMTQSNGFMHGTPYQTLGYNANGGSVDWLYGEQTTKNKIMAFSPEAGDQSDGFYPVQERIIPIAKSFADMNTYLALFAGKYGAITDNNSTFINGSGFMKFNMQCLGLDTPTTFTISIVPVVPGMITATSPVVLSNMDVGETRIDSVPFTLAQGLAIAEPVKFVYKIETSSGYYYSDTITRIYGTPVDVFFDQANSMANWTSSSTWNTTSLYSYSPSKSFTDSPSGDYANNANKTITTTNYINLTGALYAQLSFYARWDIEAGYDYVEALVSVNGSTWTPLCGKHTHAGSVNQDAGNPLYDGQQLSWVKEVIDLSDYLGQNIKLRFKIVSDGYTTADGFYFDDIKVSILNNTSMVNEQSSSSSVSVFPNPCQSVLNVVNNSSADLFPIQIYNMLGSCVGTITAKDPSLNQVEVNVDKLVPGIYTLHTAGNGNYKFCKKQ